MMRKNTQQKNKIVFLVLGLIFVCGFCPILDLVIQGAAVWLNLAIIRDAFYLGGKILVFLLCITAIILVFRTRYVREKLVDALIEDYIWSGVNAILVTIGSIWWWQHIISETINQSQFSISENIAAAVFWLIIVWPASLVVWYFGIYKGVPKIFGWFAKDGRWLRVIAGLAVIGIVTATSYYLLFWSIATKNYAPILFLAAYAGVFAVFGTLFLLIAYAIRLPG